MPIASRWVRTALVAAGLLVVTLIGSAHPDAALAANDVDTSERGVVKITVNIEFGGPAATQSLVDKWEDWIRDDDFWGADRSYSCTKLIIEPNFVRAGEGDSSYHLVTVVDIKHGRDYRSNVRWLGTDYRPSQHNAGGSWGNREDQDTIAHEFGHILGLPDEYDRVTGLPNPRIPGSDHSLMAKHGGSILDHHIAEVVRNHVDKLRCEWRGSGTVSETPLEDDYRTLTRSADYDFEFDVDEEGAVTGSITLTYAALLTVEGLPAADVGIAGFDPEVGGTITDPNPTRTFPLTGTLEDDELTLEIATPEDEREPIEFTILGDPGVSTGLVDGVGDEIVIEIDMTPFTPFSGPATVEGDDGSRVAQFLEEDDTYRSEWTAQEEAEEDGEGEPVG